MADLFTGTQILTTRYTPEPQESGPLQRRKRRAVYGEPVAAAKPQQPILIDVRHLLWQLDAACAGMDREMFFDEDTPLDEVQPICASCPVRQQCEDYANEHRLVGYWGGKTDAERRRSRARERAAARRAARA